MIDESVRQSNPLVNIHAGAVTCVASAADAPWVEDAVRAAPPAAWPDFDTVKTSTVRSVRSGVLHGANGDLPVHLKLFRPARLADRARDALRGARALREFHNLREAAARGLPCVTPVAAGVHAADDGSRSFLLTRTEPGVALRRGPLPGDVARRAGELLRAAHDAGLHAGDLHPGNLLQRPDGSLLLLDLTSAAFAQPLDDEARARALAFFCLDLDGSVLDPAARPLVEAYGTSDYLQRRAAQHGRRLRGRALIAFGRRATRACHHTTVAQQGRGRLYLHRPAAALHAAALAVLEQPPAPVKSGRRGSVHLGDGVVLKERTAAAARRLFRAAYLLQFAGVPCPRPVALRLLRDRGAVVFERLPGLDLRHEIDSGALGATELRRCARSLGNSLGRLHAHGLRNRDLKFDNLVRDAATGTVAIVDLDGVRRKDACDRRRRCADLGRLLAAFHAAGAPDRLAVLASFRRGYNRATQCLLDNKLRRHHRRPIEARASAWASAHSRPATA